MPGRACEGSVTRPNLPPVRASEREEGREPEAPISSDEIIKVEKHQIEQLVALGLGRYEAITAVDGGIDCRAVESLVQEQGCPVGVAIQLAG